MVSCLFVTIADDEIILFIVTMLPVTKSKSITFFSGL